MTKEDLPLSEILFPVPVTLVSCLDKTNNRPNIITIAWCGTVCSRPPLISISVRPSRYSHALITNTGDFVINIPKKAMLKQVDLCGIHSGRNTDKFDLCSFTPEPSSIISSPGIKECHINIECRLIHSKNLGTHEMFIGEAVAMRADRSILDNNNRIDFKKADPMVFNHGEYWDLGSEIGHYGFSSE